MVILVVSGIIGFGVGFFTQRLSHTVFSIFAGFVISCLVVLPPWGFFRQNPIKWQPVQKEQEQEAQAPSTSQNKKEKKKNK
uniref:Signal peptidase complex subunit 1 n=1 Tax=Steinernema glaseri TaxID=37863 RepID=A0A1I8ADA3_9BILA